MRPIGKEKLATRRYEFVPLDINKRSAEQEGWVGVS